MVDSTTGTARYKQSTTTNVGASPTLLASCAKPVKFQKNKFLNLNHIHRLGESQTKHKTTNSTRHMASINDWVGASGGGLGSVLENA